MDAVGQIHVRPAGHPGEQKRVEGHPEFLGQAGIERVKTAIITLSEIARRLHARQYRGDSGALQAVQDGGQIALRLFRGQAAQGIVAAQGDDHQLRLCGQAPVETRPPPGAGVPGDAGIEHLDPVTAPAQGRLQPGGKRLRRRQLITGHQAVAEHRDPGRLGRGPVGGPARQQQEEKPQTRRFHD